MGFLVYNPLNISGNYGTQDQLLALRWVHENIASFGEDTTKIMLVGQSAGADNTNILSSIPDTAKLLHSVVLESGSYFPLPNLTYASQANEPFVSQLNCTDPATGLACLSAANLTTMATFFVSSGAATASTFGPVLDGAMIRAQPTHPLVLTPLGFTTREGTILVVGFTPKRRPTQR
jgi:para-nitrobenzyl esterase